MVCPKCSQDVAPQPVGFTLWGGFIGAKIINHVECPACHARFNGRTGGSNDVSIGIYLAVVFVIFGVLVYYMLTSM